jgi:hypothetical protein
MAWGNLALGPPGVNPVLGGCGSGLFVRAVERIDLVRFAG